jgi:hypothetical protein
VLTHYLTEIHGLGVELAVSDDLVSTSDALKALRAPLEHTSAQQADEPYRRALITCYARMAATRVALLGDGPIALANSLTIDTNTAFVCAVPNNISKASYPDDWYHHAGTAGVRHSGLCLCASHVAVHQRRGEFALSFSTTNCVIYFLKGVLSWTQKQQS